MANIYTSLDNVQVCLFGNTTTLSTDQQARLQCILDGVEDYIFQLIGDIRLKEASVEIEKTDTINSDLIEKETVDLCNINVIKLISVNGNDFSSKVDGTDYLIRRNDSVTITNLGNFIQDLNFNVFDIVYHSGFDPVPDDIQLAIANLCGFEFAKELGKNISKEKTGPREVTFGGDRSDPNNSASDPKVISALRVINNYRVGNQKTFTP